MPRPSIGLSRPKSACFGSTEGSMQRITNFFNASDTRLHLPPSSQRGGGGGGAPPPTPPLGPDAAPFAAPFATRLQSTSHGRSRSGGGGGSSSTGDSQNDHYHPPSDFGDFLSPSVLVPTSSGHSPPSHPHHPPLPPSPVIAPFSRPGTSSGLSTASNGSSRNLPLELPRLRKKRSAGRFSKKDSEATCIAWMLEAGNSSTHLEPYDINPLAKGEPAKDLWFESGDTLVYLTAQDSSNPKYREPVFRIHSCSLMFHALGAYTVDNTSGLNLPSDNHPHQHRGQFAPTNLFLDVPVLGESSPGPADGGSRSSYGTAPEGTARNSYSSATSQVPDGAIATEPQQQVYEDPQAPSEQRIMYKIYYPVIEDDSPERPASPKRSKKKPKSSMADAGDRLQRLIDARNLLAFLQRTPLVASKKKSLTFDILSRIFVQLNLSQADDSKISLAEAHLQYYIDELNLDDVRKDDDAIVETLVLGEMWHSVRLYHEAFIHATGRWEVIENHPGLSMVSNTTRSRLDRAHINLHQIRLINIKSRIPSFDFPSVWVGDGRYPEYKGWRHAYERMRSLVMSHMKHVFGSWPPRPGRHGKGGGTTETGGLNRIVLRRLYHDLCAVYDLIVDREWLHGERIHFEGTQGGEDTGGDQSAEAKEKNEHHRKTMRSIMGEFDKSSVPVHPEMPFDQPRLPYRLPSAARRKKVGFLARFSKKFKAEEINEVLQNSYNADAQKQHSDSHLVKTFIDMEREFGMNSTVEELIGARRGAWIFMYCLLQSLVLVVVDGQGLRSGDGVEYFLCENVKGMSPWEKGANKRQTRMSGMFVNGPGAGFYSTSGMSSAANLDINPDDEIEMTYRRSHCWIVAEEWRLVRADSEDYDDDGEYGDDREFGGNGDDAALKAYVRGYLESPPDDRGPPSFSEYIPGQQVPQSPRMEPQPSQQAQQAQPGDGTAAAASPALNHQLTPVVEEIQWLDLERRSAMFDHGYDIHQYQERLSDRRKTPSPLSQRRRSIDEPGHPPPPPPHSHYHEGRSPTSETPLSLLQQQQRQQPAEYSHLTPSSVHLQPFNIDLSPHGSRPGSRRVSSSQSGNSSPATQSRSTSPAGRPLSPGVSQSRALSPAALSPTGSGSFSLRKNSAAASSRTSSPFRYSPVMRPEGASSPYSAYSSPRESPVLAPRGGGRAADTLSTRRP